MMRCRLAGALAGDLPEPPNARWLETRRSGRGVLVSLGEAHASGCLLEGHAVAGADVPAGGVMDLVNCAFVGNGHGLVVRGGHTVSVKRSRFQANRWADIASLSGLTEVEDAACRPAKP